MSDAFESELILANCPKNCEILFMQKKFGIDDT